MGDWVDNYKRRKATDDATTAAAAAQRLAIHRVGELHTQILSYLQRLAGRLVVGYVTGEELSPSQYVFFPTTVIDLRSGQKQKSGPAEFQFDLLYHPEVEIRGGASVD